MLSLLFGTLLSKDLFNLLYLTSNMLSNMRDTWILDLKPLIWDLVFPSNNNPDLLRSKNKGLLINKCNIQWFMHLENNSYQTHISNKITINIKSPTQIPVQILIWCRTPSNLIKTHFRCINSNKTITIVEWLAMDSLFLCL